MLSAKAGGDRGVRAMDASQSALAYENTTPSAFQRTAFKGPILTFIPSLRQIFHAP